MLVKSTGKSRRAEKLLEKFCDDSPVPISAPGEGGTLLTQLGIAGLWVVGSKCPYNSPSSHLPLDISDGWDYFLSRILERKMLRVLPTLLLARALNNTAGAAPVLVGFST